MFRLRTKARAAARVSPLIDYISEEGTPSDVLTVRTTVGLAGGQRQV
jgi:hypothetical protein